MLRNGGAARSQNKAGTRTARLGSVRTASLDGRNHHRSQ